MLSSGIKKTMLYCFAFLVTWALCVTRIAPSFIAGDSPETIMAFKFLGIQHPPGYALNTLLGKIFLLVPAGNIMFRSGLMAMFFNIAAAFIIFLMAQKLFVKNDEKQLAVYAALAAAVFYLFSSFTFLQGLTAKGSVYTLHCFLMAVIFLSLFYADKSIKFLYLSSFLFGLSLGNHWQSSAVLFPAMALAVFMNNRKTGVKTWLICLLFFLAGASIFAYLFIRAAAHPPAAWGDVKDLQSLLWLLGRAQYLTAGPAITFNDSFRLFKYYFSSILPGQYPALIAFVLFPGAALLIKKIPRYGYTLVLAYASYMAGLLIVSTAAGQEWVAKQFTIFLSIFTSLFSAYFFYWLAGHTGLKAKKILMPAAAALLFLLFYSGAPDHSRYFLGYDYMNNTAIMLPEGSLYFAENDLNVLGAQYEQFINGKNMDVITVALLNRDWYRKQLMQTGRVLVPLRAFNAADDIKNLMLANRGRGIFYSNWYRKNLLSFALASRGIVNGVMVGGKPGAYGGYGFFKLYAYRGIFDDKISFDDSSRMFVLLAYERCLEAEADELDTKGDIESALHIYKRAFMFFEDDNLAAKIGSIYIRKNDNDKSNEWLDTALRINPKCVNAYYLKAAAAYMLQKDEYSTRDYLMKVLELDKNNREAKELLIKLR